MRSSVVLLDFWGVVGIVQTSEHVAEMAARIDAPAEPFGRAYWRHRPDYDAGCSVRQYWSSVAAEMDINVDSVAVADLQALDVRSWSGVDDRMIELIRDLAARGRRLALLSNAPSDLVDHATAVLEDLVPQLFFSSELGLVKPQPEIFHLVLRELAVPAADVVFVDDNLENVQAARDVGMAAVHHTSVERTREQLLG